MMKWMGRGGGGNEEIRGTDGWMKVGRESDEEAEEEEEERGGKRRRCGGNCKGRIVL